MENIFAYIIATLGISIVINIILKRVGISHIIGYIMTGTIIAYAFNLHSVGHSHELQTIAEFGIVFLMFTIGLEISLAKMGRMKKEIFLNGALQMGISSFVFFLVGHYLLHLDMTSSLIVSLAFSLSSTAVVLSYLKSSKEIHTIYGESATGILVFQDIAVIPILILISFLTNDSGETLFTILSDTLVSVIIVIGVLFVIGKQVVTWLLHFSASSELDELFMGSVLFIVMASSFFAHSMGFSYSLGAFIVGMIIAETKYHSKVEFAIAPFKDILLGTFFVVVGMKIDIALFLAHFWPIVGLFLALLVLKTLFIYLFMRFSYTNANALKTSLLLSQVGEFSFVIFALASRGNLLDTENASILVLVVILSMVVTPFFIAKINMFVNQISK